MKAKFWNLDAAQQIREAAVAAEFPARPLPPPPSAAAVHHEARADSAVPSSHVSDQPAALSDRGSGKCVQAPDGEIERLMRFYSVGTVEELIAAQARHIEKLQSKLPPSPSFRPTFPRG